MSATQVRPLAGGAWNAITETSDHKVLKTTTFGITIPQHQLTIAVLALNEWHNCIGAGQHAIMAQKRAAAVKLQIQEV